MLYSSIYLHPFYFPDCTFPLDITLLVDTSKSIGEKDFAILIEWLQNVTRPLEFASGKTRVAVVSFSNHGVARFYLDTYTTRRYTPYEGAIFSSGQIPPTTGKI